MCLGGLRGKRAAAGRLKHCQNLTPIHKRPLTVFIPRILQPNTDMINTNCCDVKAQYHRGLSRAPFWRPRPRTILTPVRRNESQKVHSQLYTGGVIDLIQTSFGPVMDPYQWNAKFKQLEVRSETKAVIFLLLSAGKSS